MSTAEMIAELPRLSAAELAQVQAKLTELAAPARDTSQPNPIATHPALGIWKDRSDLPENSDSVRRNMRLRRRFEASMIADTPNSQS
jgi:hypothetical protein